ncbi:MAG: hypothetical protein KDB68_09780 [Planctomycetes bacterium]|nr:hypothetical protein [Planctomycetota bacterium]
MSTHFDAAKDFLTGPERPFDEGLIGRRFSTLWEFPSFSDWSSYDIVRAADGVVYRKAIWLMLSDWKRYPVMGYAGFRVPALNLWRSPWLRLPPTADEDFIRLEKLEEGRPEVDTNWVGIDGVGFGVGWGQAGSPSVYEARFHGNGWIDAVKPDPLRLERAPERVAQLAEFAVCGLLWRRLAEHFDEWAA